MSEQKTPEFMVKLDELRTKQIEELTEDELAFLKARRSYLRPDEVTYFGLEEAIDEQPTEKPAKKGKKSDEAAE